MREHPAHTWASVREFFRQLAAENDHFAPMHEFVEQLAASRYASALYPLQSMHTLGLSQHPSVSVDAERLSVEFEDGQFLVRYQGGPTAAVWTKRHPEGMVALERLFEHLRWFNKYNEPASRSAI